ncbi:C2 domain-containing protein 5-like isoform X3 [Lineus longissimus]|uniref:C2 domain-containing protein 5-like isoform X3 n=1 Tax=Lineus longissimus TaxID=88925 RepID=UPI00315D3B06
MPGKLKVRIIAGRDLPVMDRASDLTDAFAEVKFDNTVYKTDVYRRSLNPQWNSDWFKFEVDDEDLQDEPLQIRVLDHDTYSAHDAIGKIYIDLNPLLARDTASSISGWFPLFDTMHGIRGELHVTVKVDLFTDFNKFRQSSCGVQFFNTAAVPSGYRICSILGFVEELVVNDDPEYQWIDKIRTPRASNEARQRLFSQLSGELQRKIGLKVLEMGGNAVIGYRQCFDLEGESGIVVRAIGTSVVLSRHPNPLSPQSTSPIRDTYPLPEDGVPSSPPPVTPTCKNATSPGFPILYRRSSDSDISTPPKESVPELLSPPVPSATDQDKNYLSVPAHPKLLSFLSWSPGNSLAGSSGSGGGGSVLVGSAGKAPFHRPVLQQQSIEMLEPQVKAEYRFNPSTSTAPAFVARRPSFKLHRLGERLSFNRSRMEYPFFTIKCFPPGFLVHLGGVVSARSVKLLDRIHNPDEPETRDAWWTELRTEIRSHTRALGCHAVIGYSESTSICDEIIVLSAIGTAAVVNLRWDGDLPPKSVTMTTSLDRYAFDKEKKLHVDIHLAQANRLQDIEEKMTPCCTPCHVPYNETSTPFAVRLRKCLYCRKFFVPDVLFTTIEPHLELPSVGKGCLIQARICRQKKDCKGEINAKEISDSLPFMEYELHSQLLQKLRVKGMNAIYGLKIQVTVGDNLLVALATATGVFLAPLPPPPVPNITGKVRTLSANVPKEADSPHKDKHLQDRKRMIVDMIAKNREIYEIQNVEPPVEVCPSPQVMQVSTDESEEELSDLDLSAGNKDTYLLEIDDEDEEVLSLLVDSIKPAGFQVCNTEAVPGMPNLACGLQMFTHVWRGAMTQGTSKELSEAMDDILQSIYFKLRKMTPCALCDLDFNIELPDENVTQVSVTGVCVGIGEPQIVTNNLAMKAQDKTVSPNTSDQDDMMFHMEGLDNTPHSKPSSKTSPATSNKSIKKEKKLKYHQFPKPIDSIELTPLAYVPGAKILHYYGNLNFFFIRESTSIRESGGLSGFIHRFIAEVMAIVRAHVRSLGGNALVSYTMNECILMDNPHKNQAQCLVNVCGDAVSLLYEMDLQHVQPQYHSRISPVISAKKGSPKLVRHNVPSGADLVKQQLVGRL